MFTYQYIKTGSFLRKAVLCVVKIILKPPGESLFQKRVCHKWRAGVWAGPCDPNHGL